MSIVGTKQIVWSLAAMAFLATTVEAGSAHAFVEGRHRQFAEGYGNSNLYGSVTVNSDQESVNGTTTVPLPPGVPGVAIVPFLRSTAGESVDTSAQLFGVSLHPFAASVDAEVLWHTSLNDGDVYERHVSTSVMLLGNVFYSNGGRSCGGATRCLAVDKSISRDILNQEKTLFVGPVPITVHGVVSLTAGLDVAAEATADRLNDERWTLDGVADASWGASAKLTASFDGCAGICQFLDVSAAGSFRVLEISVTPHARAAQSTRLQGDAHYSWINRASIDLTTMIGAVTMGIDLVLLHPKLEIVSWDGYSDAWKLWGNSGSHTCAGYRNLPSSDCHDVR
jgi:hypothetical protein